jgi:glycosyltransferase involved in cell wall biosynthesis
VIHKDKWPRITIVTPSYNQGKYIERTILSVINQNYPNLEYFIIDGGSTDNTIDIIKKYEDKIDWWVSEKDRGQADAIRKGFENATGTLISWLNSDDMLFPGALKKVAKAYLKYPDASIYTGGTAIGALHDGPIRKCSFPPPPWAWLKNYGLIPIGQMSTFINRKYYKMVGGININLFHRMDADLFYRLLKFHPRVVIIPYMIGFIRFHDEAKSATAKIIYQKEQNEFIKSIGVSPFKFKILVYFSRLLRLFTGSYFKSFIVTLHLRGKRIEEIWAQHLKK